MYNVDFILCIHGGIVCRHFYHLIKVVCPRIPGKGSQ